MPQRGWRTAIRLAFRQLVIHRDPQEARRYLRQELYARRRYGL